LVGKLGDEVVATVTVIRDNPMGLPSDVFVDLNPLRYGGDRIGEISALAIKKGYRGKLLLHLIKFAYQTSVNCLGINHLIATLTTDSKAHELYESVLLFKPIEAKIETNYAFGNFRPVIAEHMNLDVAYEEFKKQYAGRPRDQDLFQFMTQDVLSCLHFPDREYNRISYPVMNFDIFKYFFTERTTAMKNMSLEQLEAALGVYQGQPQELLIQKAISEHQQISFQKFITRYRYEVSFKTMAKAGNSILPVRVLDISRNGLRISCSEPIGDEIDIVFSGFQGKAQYLKAEKVWGNELGVYGLRLMQPNASWNAMIDYFEETYGIQKPGLRLVKTA
jgi:hypothetical protein